MQCPVCHTTNPPGLKYCQHCNALLTSATDDLYEGFVPAWMQPKANPAPAESISVEDLLLRTTSYSSAQPSNLPPAPSFEPPKHNYRQAIPQPPVPPVTNPPSIKDPIKGVYKGCYYYTGPEGETVVMRLANLPARFFGAVIDYIIAAVLTFLFYLFFSIALGITAAFTSSSLGRTSRSSSSSITGSAFLDFIISNLLSIMLYSTIPFLYHVLSIMFSGQTFGHRTFGMRVIREGGKAMTLMSAATRTLWGILYGLVLVIISDVIVDLLLPMLLGKTKNAKNINEFTVSFMDSMVSIALVVFIIYLLGYLLVLLVMMLDKGRQGMHDKMAGTFVVEATPLSGKIS